MALVDVRRGERATLLVALFTCFGIIAAHTMSETARDALFLVHLPASYLPLAYLGIGLTSFALGRLSTLFTDAFGQRIALVAIVALGAIVAVVFRLAFAPGRDWLFYAYYVWVGTFATTSVVEFWLFASSIFTVAQGKRLFGLVGSGASLGTFAGAAIAALWARRLPIESLLLVAAGTLAATAFLPLLLPRAPPPRRDEVVRLPFWKLLQQRYLLHVAALVAISSLTLMLVDYQFKAAAASAVAPARLASFLGTVYGVLGGTALVMQALSGRIVKRFGVAFALGLMPALLIGGGLALPMLSLLGRALALRSTDGTLRHSLHRVAMELLYMPLSPQTRTQVKAFLDGSVGRVAQATASLLLIALAAVGLTRPLVAVLIVAFSALWLLLAWKVRRPYVERFLGTLEPSNSETHVRFPDLEGASLHVLVAALDSPDEHIVLSALELLAAQGRQRLIPTAVLDDRSPAVLAKALALLGDAGRADVGPSLPALFVHESAEVRAAAVRAAIALGMAPELLRRFAGDPSPVVRALVYLRLGDAAGLEAMADGPPAVRAALLQTTRDPALVARLAASDDPEVLRAAGHAVARLGDASLLPLLVARLSIGPSRHALRQAIKRFGGAALDELERALESPATDVATRRHVPRTISQIASPRSVAILARNLRRDRQPDGVVRYKILLGLSRLVAEQPDLRWDRAATITFAVESARRLHRYYAWRTLLERAHADDGQRATATGRLLVAILADKLVLGTQRLFRLLGVLYPRAKLLDVHLAIVHGDARARAAAIEVLENLLRSELREVVLPLFDDMPEAARFEHIARRLRDLPDGYEALLAAIGAADETLARLTAYHAAELARASAA